MTHLGDLNPRTFFCGDCQIGEQGNCPGAHVAAYTPGSRLRHYAIIASMGIVGILVFLFGIWQAARV